MRYLILIALILPPAVVLSDSAKASVTGEQGKRRRSSASARKNNPQQIRELINAADRGDTSKLIEILNQGVNVNATFKRDDSELSGMSALMVASSRGYAEMVAKLIERGANVNLKRYDGFTPLLFAASKGDAKIVDALLRAGANPNVQVGSFHAGEITPLIRAINSDSEQRLEVVRILISGKAQINPKGAFVMSPLVHAVGDLEMVKLLIANGADVNQKNFRGATALMAAAIDGTPSVVRYLLEQKADVNARDKDGTTALKCAEGRSEFAGAEREEIIQLLKRAEAASKP